MSVPDNWYESFFYGVTLDLWRRAIPPEQTTAEAEFLIQQLNCDRGAHVLDVPCGNGRLSFDLANRGLQVTGIDISEEFIEEARARLNNNDDTGRLDFILSDMRLVKGTG